MLLLRVLLYCECCNVGAVDVNGLAVSAAAAGNFAANVVAVGAGTVYTVVLLFRGQMGYI